MNRMRRHLLTLAIVAAGLLAPSLSHAQSPSDNYSIMKPEPWLAPKYQSPRSAERAPPPSQVLPPSLPRQRVPRDLYVPQTGRVVPNLPALSPSGPNGAETSQDRAMRCAHQSGMAGEAGGDRNAYLGTCVNQ